MSRNKLFGLLSLLVILSMALSAVAGCAPEATAEPTEEAVEEPEEEEAAEEPEEEAAEEEEVVEEKVIRFGAPIGLTGIKATESQVQKDGMDFWVNWVNTHGGIDVGGEKYMVEIVYYDDESDPQTAAKLTEKLITEDETKFLFAPFGSVMTIASCAVGEKYGAITVAPLANSGSIYNQGYEYVFSVLPPAANYLRLLVEMAATELDPKPETVAVLAMDDPFGISCAEGTRDWAEEAGFEVVLYEKYPLDAKDLSSLLTKVKGLDPDLVLVSSQFEQSLLITRQAKELQVSPKLMGFTVGPTFPAFIETLGPDSEYIFGSEWWLANMGWKDEEFGDSMQYAELFEAEYGYAPDYHAAAGTAAGRLYQFAIEAAGTLEVDAVRDALAELDVEFFWGPHAYDDKGQNRKGASGPIQVQDATHVAVYPEAIRQADPIYPMPAWDER